MLGASAVAANAQTYVADDGYVEFVSTAPLLEFKGKSNHLTGMIDLEENLVDFYVDLTTLDTGINLRNNHMRDSYLETDDYPFAEFTGSLVSPYDPQKGGKQEVVAAGKFKIHGVEREIEIPGMLEKTADGLHLKASWTLLLEDYDIRRPQVVFYELAQEQDVSISITLKRE
ncbi:MAG: YceI family protein [Bacteroidetes bacterium]|nr:YceI family protein [Bacteroidota bacterium]